MSKLAHVGLNAPQDSRTQTIVENFEKFSYFLLEKGVPVATVNAIRKEVSKYTSRGQDPQFRFTEKGIVVENKLFPVRFRQELSAEPGLGAVVATTLTVLATTKAIMEMLPPNFFGDTFGQIFSDGLDCWNTGNTPSKSKGEVGIDGPDFYKRANLESEGVSAANINKFVEMAEIYIAARAFGEKNGDLAECTREGNTVGKELMQAFLDKTLMELRSRLSREGYSLRTVSQESPSSGRIKINSSYHNGSISKTRYGVRVNVYQIETKDAPQEEPSPAIPEDNTTTDENTPVDTPTTGNVNNKSSEGSNTGLIIGGVTLAALPLFFMLKKGSVAENTPGKKKTTKKTAKK